MQNNENHRFKKKNHETHEHENHKFHADHINPNENRGNHEYI